MSRPTPEVDPKELDAYLATAPPNLREWADAQREQLALGPTLAELTEADALPDDETRPPIKAAASGIASGINKVLVALLAAAIVLLVQQWGRPTQQVAQSPHGDMNAMQQGMTQFAQLDNKRVEELKKQLEDEPNNVAALKELGKLYNDAGQWQESLDFQNKVLALTPDDYDALLASGVIHFNLGELAKAEESWLKATKSAPDKPEGHFNLGFIYLAKEPAEKEKARQSWENLIRIAPDSQLAETAKSHLEQLDKEQ
ncbi:tetratricopeptide repeat protein [Tessaracoccus sp. OH4464_COT-324]|uniref:tetratricopeptide repeat protein n=1 Tax=Tessaracoccus sp. OH4464_COT-324 TaxID=2491059 RepID=UPI000F6382D5|nr:tetratricopeptide repeat protein [Tessaracoccus sp. OH4464_COT-324]RRD47203.1 hypothetical protein EII42_04270 [Tessaracoccus sp. OH4464_COT-324]